MSSADNAFVDSSGLAIRIVMMVPATFCPSKEKENRKNSDQDNNSTAF
jgi:hypothetical protein